MMGRRSAQRELFTADSQYLDFVGRETFYGFLAAHGREIFRDEDFAEFYCEDNGRRSVPPSLLVVAMVLQAYDKVSDDEAKQRADFDLRWKVALGVELEERPFAKSTLQCFRTQLLMDKEKGQALLDRSLKYARARGLLQERKMRLALDTTVILGRGAVRDTYNLVGDGIKKLCRALARVEGTPIEAWSEREGFRRYFGSSLKGGAEVDWDDAASREAFLTEVIEDGQRLIQVAVAARSECEAESPEDRVIASGAELLGQLLRQDVEPSERGGWRIRKGTAPDRIPSAQDPEQRHGHKSHGKSFTGHKGAVAVDVESGLVTAVAVVAGNASDGDSAAELVKASEARVGTEAEQVLGDTAYGSMAVRATLGDREVIAPTVKGSGRGAFPKEAFEIDVAGDRVRCPAGHETQEWAWVPYEPRRGEPKVQVKRFAFPKELCQACPHYAVCGGRDKRRRRRFITLHPDEEALQAARAFERTEYFREQYHQRVVVEHRIARLAQLGIRQSRFVGRAKTEFQLLMAATVANLTLAQNAGRSSALPGCSEALLAPLSGALRRLLECSGVLWALSRAPRRLPGVSMPMASQRRPLLLAAA